MAVLDEILGVILASHPHPCPDVKSRTSLLSHLHFCCSVASCHHPNDYKAKHDTCLLKTPCHSVTARDTSLGGVWLHCLLLWLLHASSVTLASLLFLLCSRSPHSGLLLQLFLLPTVPSPGCTPRLLQVLAHISSSQWHPLRNSNLSFPSPTPAQVSSHDTCPLLFTVLCKEYLLFVCIPC